jgi:hypothetical protein
MIVHLHDFQGLDVDIDLPDTSTVADLRSRLQADGAYDPANAQFFKSGRQLEDSTIIATLDFSGDNVIVVLKRDAFGDRSFPTHQPPSEYGRSRLREFFIENPAEPPPRQPAAREEHHGFFGRPFFMRGGDEEVESFVLPSDIFLARGDGPEEEDGRDGDEHPTATFIAEMGQRGIPRRVVMQALAQAGYDLDAAEELLEGAQMPILRMS